MTPRPRPVTSEAARRLAISAQELDAPARSPDHETALDVVRRLGCLQLDPISVVARSHELVLFSRLGPHDRSLTHRLAYERKDLFEYWAHMASLVPTSDLPLHRLVMLRARRGAGRYAEGKKWIEDNAKLRRHVMRTLRDNGPTRSRDIGDLAQGGRRSSGWTDGRSVSRMLNGLWIRGRITVADRRGGERCWDLAERHLPPELLKARPLERKAVREAAVRSLRALGVGTAQHIRYNFLRHRYPGLEEVLAGLMRRGEVLPVRIHGPDGVSDAPYLMHADDLPRLEAIEAGDWEGRTTALSPFDNLICDRSRTEHLFGLDFRMEIYVPRARRRYGYYVVPVLDGDRFVARIDPRLERGENALVVNAVHFEEGAGRSAARAVDAAIADLAAFLGATGIRRRGPPAGKVT